VALTRSYVVIAVNPINSNLKLNQTSRPAVVRATPVAKRNRIFVAFLASIIFAFFCFLVSLGKSGP
jgi:hypothetical protein